MTDRQKFSNGPPIEIQERSLVVNNLDCSKISKELLEELFSNFGPINKIVVVSNRSMAYVEYSDKHSVAYAL